MASKWTHAARRQRRQYYIENGLCSNCGGRQPVTGRRQCSVCAEAKRHDVRRTYADRVTARVCSRCGKNPPRSGALRCAECLDAQRSYDLRRIALDPDFNRRYLAEYRAKNPGKNQEWRMQRKLRLAASPGVFTQGEWDALVIRQRNRCAACNKRRKLTVDHIIPISRGGSNLIMNIQGLCQSCNSRKNNRMPDGHHPTLFDRVA